MTDLFKIEKICTIIEGALPSSMLNGMRFLPPDTVAKKGSRITRGRILGKSSNHIWNNGWCFYEVGIGFYNVDPPNDRNVGGIGLVCFVNNAQCGAGKHRSFMERFVGRYASLDAKLSPSRPTWPNQGVFRYYRKGEYSSFPVEQAAADLAVLIDGTYRDMDRLSV